MNTQSGILRILKAPALQISLLLLLLNNVGGWPTEGHCQSQYDRAVFCLTFKVVL